MLQEALRLPVRGAMKRSWRLLFACLGVVVILVGTAGPASAHAQLEFTSPAPSSVLLQSPSQVVLHFGEPVEIDFGSLRVLGPTGQRIDNGGTHHPPGDSHAVAISLPKHLARGTYVVAWRVISADSHPVHGAFVFSVGSASGAGRGELTGQRPDQSIGESGDRYHLLVRAVRCLCRAPVSRGPGLHDYRRLATGGTSVASAGCSGCAGAYC